MLEHPLLDGTWSRYAAGERGSDQHVHRRHVDAFLVLDGELELRLGPERTPVHLPAGTFGLVPPNLAHMFAVAGDRPAEFLNFHAPSMGFISYLRGDRSGFDQHEPGTRDGLSGAEAAIARAGAGAGEVTLGHHPAIAVSAIGVDPDSPRRLPVDDGHVHACYVLEGEVDFEIGGTSSHGAPRTWARVPADSASTRLRAVGPNRAYLISVRAPGVIKD
jgi:quercetin dioxygenase-like cupin family protein